MNPMTNYSDSNPMFTNNYSYVTDNSKHSELSNTYSKVEDFKLQFDDGELILPLSEKQRLSKESSFFDQLFNGHFKEKNQSEITLKMISASNFEIMRSLIDQDRWNSKKNFEIDEFVELYRQATQLEMNSSIRIIRNEIENFIEGLGYADEEINCVMEIQKRLQECEDLSITFREYFLNYITTGNGSNNKIKYVISIKNNLKVEDSLNEACHDHFRNYILNNESIPPHTADSLKEITQHINSFCYLDHSVKDLENLKTYYPNINKIRFLYRKNIDNESLHLETICKTWPNLQELDFSNRMGNEDLIHLKSLTNLRKLTLQACRITNEGLKHLTFHPSLQELYLSELFDEIDISLENFKSCSIKKLDIRAYIISNEFSENFLPNLQELNLNYCKIQKDAIKYLKFPYNLQKLDLSWCDLSGKELNLTYCSNLQKLDLRKCKNMTEFGSLKFLTNLRSLNLADCNITNNNFEDLKSLSKLQKLDLSMCKNITDEGFKHLKIFLSLKKLNLSGTQIKELKPLKFLNALEKLYLIGCQITDACLEHLKSITNLQELDLSHCENITDEGLEEFESNFHLRVD